MTCCRYGLRGFYSNDQKPITLTRKQVEGIHLRGGTILGTSRGGADMKEIVHRIDLWGLDMVFVIGGNGTYSHPLLCLLVFPEYCSNACDALLWMEGLEWLLASLLTHRFATRCMSCSISCSIELSVYFVAQYCSVHFSTWRKSVPV